MTALLGKKWVDCSAGHVVGNKPCSLGVSKALILCLLLPAWISLQALGSVNLMPQVLTFAMITLPPVYPVVDVVEIKFKFSTTGMRF